MIFYENAPRINKLKEAVLTLDDFSGGLNNDVDGNLSGGRYADASFNFSFKSGALKDGVGIEKFSLPTSDGGKRTVKFPTGVHAVKLYYFRRYDQDDEKYEDMLLAYASDGKIYETYIIGSSDTFTEVTGLSFNTTPKGINYKFHDNSVIILSSPDDGMFVYDGTTVQSVPDSPSITSMCIHYERLYVTTGGEGTALWFSDDFDPTNWYVSIDEAGFIDFQDDRGALIKAVSFLDYVYVFRSYGISKLSAYGDQQDFSVSGLFVSNGKIYPDSITVCGDRIIFLAGDGLYSFDGNSTVRILRNLDGYILGVDNFDAKGEFYNGKLYLRMKIRCDDAIEDVVLVYSVSENVAYFYKGEKVTDVCAILSDDYSNLLFVTGSDCKIGMISESPKNYDEPLEKIWRTPFTDFGVTGSSKILKGLSLYTDGDITLTVESESHKKIFKLKGSKRRVDLTPAIRGDVFRITVKSILPSARVSSIRLTFNLI